jgi:imidazolonepropionase-like amidohydrolase
MKPSLCLVGMALMLFVAFEPSSAQDLAFIGVNVVPMDRHGLLNDQTVVVRDGRISAVGPTGSTRVPDEALRLEGRGKYLMPGLGEMHGHIPSPL